jgi:hypothetical protein
MIDRRMIENGYPSDVLAPTSISDLPKVEDFPGLAAGAYVEAQGVLLVDNDIPTMIADRICVLPGDPDDP